MSKELVASDSQPDVLIIDQVGQEGDDDERKFWHEPDWGLLEANRSEMAEQSPSTSQNVSANEPISTLTIDQEQEEANNEAKCSNDFNFGSGGNPPRLPLSEMDSHESSAIEQTNESSASKKRRNPVEFRLLSSIELRKSVTNTSSETVIEGGVSAIDLLLNIPETPPTGSSPTASNSSARSSRSRDTVSSLNHANKRKQQPSTHPRSEDIDTPSTSDFQASKQRRKLAVQGERAVKQQLLGKQRGAQRRQKVQQEESIEAGDVSFASSLKQKPPHTRQRVQEEEELTEAGDASFASSSKQKPPQRRQKQQQEEPIEAGDVIYVSSSKQKPPHHRQKLQQEETIEVNNVSFASSKQKPSHTRRQTVSSQATQSIEAVVSSVVAEVHQAGRVKHLAIPIHSHKKNENEERESKQQLEKLEKLKTLEIPAQAGYQLKLDAASQRYRQLCEKGDELERKRAAERDRQRLARQRRREQQTPELAAQRRAQEAERVRRRRAFLREQLPEDVIAERRRIDAERMRERRLKLRGLLPKDVVTDQRRLEAERMRRRREELRQNSEAMAERRAIERERTRRYRERKRLGRTPEELELIRRAVAERRKLIQQQGLLSGAAEAVVSGRRSVDSGQLVRGRMGSGKMSTRKMDNGQMVSDKVTSGQMVSVKQENTPERSDLLSLLLPLPAIEPHVLPPNIDPAEIDRLALAAERARLSKLQRRIQMRLTETPEQAAERRRKECEQKRRSRQQLTPEQLAIRRQSECLRLREYYRQLKHTNTEAMKKRQENLRRYKQQKRLTETPEERAKRLNLRQECRRRLQERLSLEEAAVRRRAKVEQARLRKMLKTGQPPKTPYTPKDITPKDEIGDCWKSGCDGRTILTSRRHNQYFYGKLLYCKKCRSVKSLEKKRKWIESADSDGSIESPLNHGRSSMSTRVKVKEEESGEIRRSVRLQSKGANKRKYRWWNSSNDVETESDADNSHPWLRSDDDNQSTSNSQNIDDFQTSDPLLSSMQGDSWNAWQNTIETSDDQQVGKVSDGSRSSSVVEGFATESVPWK